MKAISIYSGGCDGLSLAAKWAGMEVMAFCECDKDCRKLIALRHPDKPIFEYDTEVTADALRTAGIDPNDIDIILASPPCQCASVAGKRLGSADERNRWPECLRIVRDVRPRWFMAENVPGLLSVDDGRLYGDILRHLAESGYDVVWYVFGACDVGAPHKRERLCIVAYRDDGRRGQIGESRVGGEMGKRRNAANMPSAITNCGAVAYRNEPKQSGFVTNADAARLGRFANGGNVGDTEYDGQSAKQKLRSNEASGDQRGQKKQESSGKSAGANGSANVSGICRCTNRSERCRKSMGNASRAGRKEYNTPKIASTEGYPAGKCSVGIMGDAKCGGLQGQHGRRTEPQPTNGHETDGSGATQSCLGMLLDGLSARLDDQRWPAGRGEPQYDWEPPRVAEGVKGRVAMIKMLGNAVVPQWAYVTLVLIAEIDRQLAGYMAI